MMSFQVQSRKETLEKLQFSQSSPVFKFTASRVDEVKKSISSLGSIGIE